MEQCGSRTLLKWLLLGLRPCQNLSHWPCQVFDCELRTVSPAFQCNDAPDHASDTVKVLSTRLPCTKYMYSIPFFFGLASCSIFLSVFFLCVCSLINHKYIFYELVCGRDSHFI